VRRPPAFPALRPFLGVFNEGQQPRHVRDADRFADHGDALGPELAEGPGKAFGLHSETIGDQGLLKRKFKLHRTFANRGQPDEKGAAAPNGP
jgi:hypothetical protein